MKRLQRIALAGLLGFSLLFTAGTAQAKPGHGRGHAYGHNKTERRDGRRNDVRHNKGRRNNWRRDSGRRDNWRRSTRPAYRRQSYNVRNNRGQLVRRWRTVRYDNWIGR